ncbi:hypothetical protein H8A97_09505 [Bradyrhizobium sp. Arg62]|uniref:hypothetical protein n=1 Tax=Bradyrhizobium brasilense TaxID=1419277 RepID=UPI001E5E3DD6|nr:hypothetical protein [Bradyrhizobium brasilense]MCC8945332.1 hypothetical protein [Bradyrhizobium brasilense]
MARQLAVLKLAIKRAIVVKGALGDSGIRFPQRVAGLKPGDQDAARHTATINVVRIVPMAREIAQAGTVADWPALFGHQQRDGATKRVEERR